MRSPIRTLAPVAATLAAGLLLAGCGDVEPLPGVTQGARPTAAPPTEAPAAATKAPAAASRQTVGGPGTACVLPVSFGVAEKWTPKAIEDPENPEFAALTRQGPATVRCEVDAKPAGHVGFLRVWTARKGSARTALEGFVKAERNTSEVTYKESGSGSGPVTEVTYTVFDKLTEESKEERAFAVSTPEGAVIVHLGGLDTAEHRAMIPAYELARTTLRTL
ncbi:lipoprotein [Streptomyces flavochromogenes]|uniref:lipoprotein n=1 Tax=Streptomyces flavochromogenes TaxID=68199 RepID=UPI0004BE8193|nr:lipoprotein [Streptomyces flavochromogenes]